MSIDYSRLSNNHYSNIEKILFKDKLRYIIGLSPKIRKLRREFLKSINQNLDEKEIFNLYSDISKQIDTNRLYRFSVRLINRLRDFKFYKKNAISCRGMKKALSVGDGYSAIVCIVKNEARYLDEWICFYKLMGIDHIYLFNNNSTDDIESVVKKHIDSGFVIYADYPGKNAQLPLYRLACRNLKRYRWVAFIDADEFVFPNNGVLVEYLRGVEQYPAIGINWIVFGTGGHEKRPDGLVMENYLETFEERNNELNLRIKCIVNPKEVYDVTSPHFCVLNNGEYAYDEDGNPIDTKWMYVCGSGPAFTKENKTKKIRINHYWTKSQQDLFEKCNRGYAAGSFSPDYKSIMERIDFPQTIDKEIQKYVQPVKEMIILRK